MKRFLIFGTLLTIQLFFLSACRGTKVIRLQNADEVREEDVVRVRFPIDILVLSVNDQKTGEFFDYLSSKEKEIQLDAGEHEIVVRYSDFWEYDEDHFEKFRSGKVVLTFKAEAGQTYRVTHPRLRNMKEAAKFTKIPDIWIEEEVLHTKVSSSQAADSEVENDIALSPNDAESSAERDDETLEKDWKSLSEEEKKQFREWMEKRDKE